jgi:hypothetical protein
MNLNCIERGFLTHGELKNPKYPHLEVKSLKVYGYRSEKKPETS